ncbi:protein NRT1/ PTR FAMILY 5.2-like [Iris pallida]|uniref:Protein NRT1/ PTR FAMILY 5.2-like n=1 Tax=Iris pallida TaxID=29817 RepID=A0AAX6F0Y9_IRIPA|nr:protein NRT1/ PTR FAMILY 5.2-like [Iris pallida]
MLRLVPSCFSRSSQARSGAGQHPLRQARHHPAAARRRPRVRDPSREPRDVHNAHAIRRDLRPLLHEGDAVLDQTPERNNAPPENRNRNVHADHSDGGGIRDGEDQAGHREKPRAGRERKTRPASIFMILPQFVLMGISDAFFVVGKIEIFYEQAPQSMKSLGSSCTLTALGLGNVLSSLLLKLVSGVTERRGRGWVLNNLNASRLDYTTDSSPF